jgi:biopolymer transport protein ExbB/TolQ
MSERYNSLILSISMAIGLSLFIALLTFMVPEGGLPHRLLILLGGNFPAGLIQTICYFLFFYGVFEIKRINRGLATEKNAFNMGLLPETEQYVLLPDDVAKLKLQMIELERKGRSLLVDLIKKSCTKFRSSHSIPETMEMVSKQSAINLRDSESEQSIIRYIAWAIPSVGFVGTVIGIAASLSAAKGAVSAQGIERVTGLLNIAFDTTLVALILSLIIMFLYHNLQEKVEKLHSRLEAYVLENLVNRIFQERPAVQK